MIKRNCLRCGSEFEVPLSRTKEGKGKFCSRGCLSRTDIREKSKEIIKMYIENNLSLEKISKKFDCSKSIIYLILKENKINTSLSKEIHKKNCLQCGKEYKKEKNYSLKEWDNRKFCSKECCGKYNTGKPTWNLNLTKETDERLMKSSRTKIDKFSKGELKVWNDGLTSETDERIKCGENHPRFNNWSSLEPYGHEFNLKLKNIIRKRDNQVCMNCGIHREKLNEALTIHHINYDKQCNINENLISLCKRCHSITNGNREYWRKLLQDKISKLYGYQYSEDGKIILKLQGVSNG